MIVVGAPAYFEKRNPTQTPHDLTDHVCVNLRMPTYGGFYAWEFQNGARAVKVRVTSQFVATTGALRLKAALEGLGLAYVFEVQAQPHLDAGRLMRVLSDWTPPFAGYHLYFPSRGQPSPAFLLLVDAVRYRK